jgi:hypothetical protein
VNWDTTDLDCAEILAACISCVPVNVRLDQAIAAHRIAFKAFERQPSYPEIQKLASYTLRAVVMARMPEIVDYRAQLDYLTGLPLTAWPETAEHSARECRDETLAGTRRSIGWAMAG